MEGQICENLDILDKKLSQLWLKLNTVFAIIVYSMPD